MPNNSKTYIVNDQPTDTDALDFTPYVETLADIASTGNTPLTIEVFGTWGSGKTSLMKMVKKHLPANFTVAWFDAWKYDKEETLWRAFLLSVLTALKESAQAQGKPTEEFEKMQSLLYRGLEVEKVGGVTIDLTKLGGAFAKGAVNLSLSFIPGGDALKKLVEALQSNAGDSVNEATEAISRERTKIYIEQVQFLEQFQEKFAKLIQTHVAPKRLVVFVDDLDRCLPEKAIEVLEAIKLFLDAEHCVFILGLDQAVIARGIEMKYKEFGEKQDSDASQQKFTVEGVRYLEKIIQLPFQIPPVEQTDMGNFVHGLRADWPHEECPKVFAVGLGDSPRQIKRAVNTFLMLWKLAEKRKEKLKGRIKPIRLAKVVAIQTVYPDLYNLILKDEPRYLRELEEYYRSLILEKMSNTSESLSNKDSEEPHLQQKDNGDKKIEISRVLEPFLFLKGAIAVRRILTLHALDMQDANFANLSDEEIISYFTLTARVEAPQPSSTVLEEGINDKLREELSRLLKHANEEAINGRFREALSILRQSREIGDFQEIGKSLERLEKYEKLQEEIHRVEGSVTDKQNSPYESMQSLREGFDILRYAPEELVGHELPEILVELTNLEDKLYDRKIYSHAQDLLGRLNKEGSVPNWIKRSAVYLVETWLRLAQKMQLDGVMSSAAAMGDLLGAYRAARKLVELSPSEDRYLQTEARAREALINQQVASAEKRYRWAEDALNRNDFDNALQTLDSIEGDLLSPVEEDFPNIFENIDSIDNIRHNIRKLSQQAKNDKETHSQAQLIIQQAQSLYLKSQFEEAQTILSELPRTVAMRPEARLLERVQSLQKMIEGAQQEGAKRIMEEGLQQVDYSLRTAFSPKDYEVLSDKLHELRKQVNFKVLTNEVREKYESVQSQIDSFINDTNIAMFHLQKGKEALEQNDYEQAISYLQKALEGKVAKMTKAEIEELLEKSKKKLNIQGVVKVDKPSDFK